MPKNPFFANLIKILPRTTLEALCSDYAGVKSPWHSDRSNLEKTLISRDSEELREELRNYVKENL
jgi:hypothetical protein